jgi:hypothetical protein
MMGRMMRKEDRGKLEYQSLVLYRTKHTHQRKTDLSKERRPLREWELNSEQCLHRWLSNLLFSISNTGSCVASCQFLNVMLGERFRLPDTLSECLRRTSNRAISPTGKAYHIIGIK